MRSREGEFTTVKQLTVGGVDIAYLDEGKGPVVILGHCSSASHKEWLPLIETLKADWRVLAPDFIGYGQSDPWPAEQPFSIDADMVVLLALAKKTKGHSIWLVILMARLSRLKPRARSARACKVSSWWSRSVPSSEAGRPARMGGGRDARRPCSARWPRATTAPQPKPS